MLIKKAEQVVELSEETIKLRNYTEQLSGFKSRQEHINQVVAEILPLVSALRAFRQRGLFTFDLTQKVEPILELITITEGEFQKEPEWILDNRNFKGNIFKSNVEGLKNTLKQQLLQAWRNYLNRRLPSTNQEILSLLARIDAFKPTVQVIKNLDALISRNEFPKSNEEFESIEQLIDQLRESWDSLSSDEVPDAVLHFLRAAANNQGAPLILLTSQVQAWIDRNGIADSLRIHLR